MYKIAHFVFNNLIEIFFKIRMNFKWTYLFNKFEIEWNTRKILSN